MENATGTGGGVNYEFIVWLDAEMRNMGIDSDLELARRGGFNSGSLSNLRKGSRRLGLALALGIARGLKADPVVVLTVAGLLPKDTRRDDIVNRLARIVGSWPLEERVRVLESAQDRDAAIERARASIAPRRIYDERTQYAPKDTPNGKPKKQGH